MTYDTKASRAIMSKRTPGEWCAENHLEGHGGTLINGPEANIGLFDGDNETLDAHAIVHAVNNHDAMCDEIDRLRDEVQDMHEAADLIEAQALAVREFGEVNHELRRQLRVKSSRIAELELHKSRAAEMARAAEDPSWFYGCQGGKYSWEP